MNKILEAVIELEKLRQQIMSFKKTDNYYSMADDRVSFSDSDIQKRNENKKQLNERQALLDEKVKAVRTNLPAVIEAWVEMHKNACDLFIASHSSSNESTKAHVARENKQDWEKVKKGEVDYILENTYYLASYTDFVNKVISNLLSN